jgi:hypothetical protein
MGQSTEEVYTRINNVVRLEVFTAVTKKNYIFWDTKTQFVLHRDHILSPLQSSAG